MEIDVLPVAHDQFGRSAADVDDHHGRVVLRVAVAGGAEEGQARLLVAGQDLGAQAVVAGDLVDEGRTVGGVAHGAG